MFFDVFKIWPPGGARPFVYFFVFACLHHVPLRSTRVSFHEVITFYNIKLFLKSIFVPMAWGSCNWQFCKQTVMSFVYRALQALFIVYENTFEIKNGKGHYKLSFETKNIKIGSVWGALGAKNCSKMGQNWAEICLQCSTGFVYCLWKNFEAKTGLGHYKLSFDTINIEVWSLEIAPVAENCSKMGRNWAEICLQCSVDFVFCLWKNFSNQNWWGTLKALIWDHEHWGLIILSCPKGKKLLKKGIQVG